ncbi:MAG: LysR family transcriptional regulator [bacterium]|nr:LysR family transcriptional regulator [bacterium]
MKLSGINLNLLIALDALLDEQSVTKAAERLNLSQAQLSYILKELRSIFDDILLVRGVGYKMELTEKAISLILPVNEAMAKIEDIFLGQDTFFPKVSKAHFKIGGWDDYLSSLFCPELFKDIYTNAPNIDIDIIDADIDSYSSFVTNKLDIAVGTYDLPPNKICSEKLFNVKPVVLVSEQHETIKDKKSLNSFFNKYPLLLVYRERDFKVDFFFELMDKKYGKGNYKYSTFAYPEAVLKITEDSEYICITSSVVAETLANPSKYQVFDVPFSIPETDFKFSLYWKKQDTDNQANIWLRNKIRNIFREKFKIK